MITVEQLAGLLEKYGLNVENVLSQNDNILTKGSFDEIEYVLSYLINELNITPGNVEKSSSVMYASVNNLRANYEFLATTNIGKRNIETCLHILKVDPEQLKETYEYVLERYGEKILKEKTSILFLKVDIIEIYEDRLKDSLDNQLLIASMTSNPKRLIADYTYETAVNDVKRIEEIIDVCNKEKISITPITFHRSVEDVKKIIELCKEKSIKVEAGMFRKTADEVNEIVELCIEKGIEAKGTIFHRTADEIKDIIKLCEDKSIEADGTIFYRTADEIEKIIKMCEEMGISPGTTVFLRTPDEVKSIAKVCETKGIKPDGALFLRRADEIEKIVEVCKTNGIEPNGEVFYRTSEEIEDIVKVCEKKGIKAEGPVFFKRADELERILEICEKKDVKISNDLFRRTASEIEKIVDLCEKRGIKAEGSIFIRTAEEIEQIIKLYETEGIQKIDKTAFLQKPEEIENIIKICKNKNIKMTGSIFRKSSKKLISTIEYIEGNYSSTYLTPGILSKNVKYLKEVLPYLESIGLLEYIIESPGILTLTIDEIKERQKFLADIEERIVVDNKLNTIFGVARSRYEKRKENIKAKRNIGMVK